MAGTMNNFGVAFPFTVPSGGTGAITFTAHGLLVGNVAGTVQATAAGLTGQYLLSSGASADPVWSTTTIVGTVTQGDLLYASANNVVSALAKDANATRYLSNTGVANAPLWSQIALTTGVSGVLPVANGGTGQSTAFYSAITVSQSIVAGNGYICNAPVTIIVLTLPATAVVGDMFEIVGMGAASYSIAQNALQSVKYNGVSSTVGITGTVTPTAYWNRVKVVCTATNTDFLIIDATGTGITLA